MWTGVLCCCVELLFPVAFPGLSVQSMLVDHLVKGPTQRQLLKVVVQVLAILNAFSHGN